MLRISTIKNWKRLIGDLRSRKEICPNEYRFLFRPRFYAMSGIKPEVNSLTDDRVLKEVMRLGALQKKLFIDGKRVGDREYAEVLIAITEYHRALLSRLMAD